MATPDNAFIIQMYRDVLPLIHSNPDKVSMPIRVLWQVQQFMPIDHTHYVGDIEPDPEPGKVHAVYERDNNGTSISLKKMDSDELAFDEIIEYSRTNTMKLLQGKFPDAKAIHYHEIRATEAPFVVGGYFRVQHDDIDNRFTPEEIETISALTPDLILLLRVALAHEAADRRLQHFNTYSIICSRLANEYHLTDTENKLVTELLVGYSNEQIAERNFVSVSTVKTHLQHIFKKTETKNRMDFIGKFFTSPERMKL